MGQIDLWDISYWKNGEIDPATGTIYEDETLTGCYTDTKIPVIANGSCIITATKFAAGVTLKIFEFNDSDELQNTPSMLRLPQVYATGKNASYIRIMLSNKKSSYDFTDGSMTVTSDAIKEASPTIQKILDRILRAVFGRDVRQSIHDGIKIANDKVDEYTEKQNALDMKYSNLLDEMSKANPSLAEVVDARANAENKIYNNLKERLDTEAGERYKKTEVYSKTESYSKDEVYNKDETLTRNEIIAVTGNLTNLNTKSKSDLVAAINEAFQYANDGKNKIATAIGNGATSDMSFSEIANIIKRRAQCKVTSGQTASKAFDDVTQVFCIGENGNVLACRDSDGTTHVLAAANYKGSLTFSNNTFTFKTKYTGSDILPLTGFNKIYQIGSNN